VAVRPSIVVSTFHILHFCLVRMFVWAYQSNLPAIQQYFSLSQKISLVSAMTYQPNEQDGRARAAATMERQLERRRRRFESRTWQKMNVSRFLPQANVTFRLLPRLWALEVLISSKNFQIPLSYRILRHMYRALNIYIKKNN